MKFLHSFESGLDFVGIQFGVSVIRLNVGDCAGFLLLQEILVIHDFSKEFVSGEESKDLLAVHVIDGSKKAKILILMFYMMPQPSSMRIPFPVQVSPVAS